MPLSRTPSGCGLLLSPVIAGLPWIASRLKEALTLGASDGEVRRGKGGSR